MIKLAPRILLDTMVRDDLVQTEVLMPMDVGTQSGLGTYVAIKSTVFDVSGNESYAPGKGYHGMTRIQNVCIMDKGQND